MKKLLAIVFLSTLSGAAFALEPESGMVIDIAGGYTPSILAVDSGISRGGYLGYKFNTVFSVEGGYTSLLNQSHSGSSTLVSLAGPEVAGIIRFTLNNRVSPFIRAGYTRLTDTQTTNGIASGIENVYGPSYGVGLQFYETDHFSLRFGYTEYHLQTSGDYNVQAGVPFTTSNYYAGLLIEF